MPLEKKLNTVSAHFPLHAVEEVIEYLGLKHPIRKFSNIFLIAQPPT